MKKKIGRLRSYREKDKSSRNYPGGKRKIKYYFLSIGAQDEVGVQRCNKEKHKDREKVCERMIENLKRMKL